MKLWVLIDLSLILMLVLNSKGQEWSIKVPGFINASLGSNVIIPCNFSYPEKFHTDNVKVYWKKKGEGTLPSQDKDKNAFITHTNPAFVLEKYRNKTKLIGNVTEGNCSLMILDIKENEQNIYVRIVAKDSYSFVKNTVYISANDTTNSQFTPAELTESETFTEATLYVVTFVPISALLIIIVVTGIICYRKRKRSQTFTREESGYYENFSRELSNQTKSEASCKINEDMKCPKLKAIDEPVYVNTELPTALMAQSQDHIENVYANV